MALDLIDVIGAVSCLVTSTRNDADYITRAWRPRNDWQAMHGVLSFASIASLRLDHGDIVDDHTYSQSIINSLFYSCACRYGPTMVWLTCLQRAEFATPGPHHHRCILFSSQQDDVYNMSRLALRHVAAKNEKLN